MLAVVEAQVIRLILILLEQAEQVVAEQAIIHLLLAQALQIREAVVVVVEIFLQAAVLAVAVL
jgi:hypothetical protein